MTVQAVVFDIGNVLIGWNPEGFYDARLGADTRKQMWRETGIEAMNLAVDAGAPMRETVQALADRHPRWRAQILWWHDHWIEMASPRIDGSIALLRALRKKGVAVFALTNFGDDTFTYAQTHYDFLAEFDRAYVSGRMGVIKPDPLIYAMLEEDCGVAPGALLFADDRPENIAAARLRGWKGHIFTDWQGWAARLVAEGLLTETEAGL